MVDQNNRLVSDHLRSLVYNQVKDHGLVVWYDPEGHYREFIKGLDIPGSTIACYEGSFFDLRFRIDPLLTGNEPPRLVIYVPLDRSRSHSALVEAEAAGVVMRPGQLPRERNTRLSILARNALKQILGDEATVDIEKQVSAGKLSLAELDSIGGRSGRAITAVIPLIFEATNPKDVIFKFLSGDKYDKRILEKGASDELALMIQCEFGLESTEGSPDELRLKLARHILATDFISGIQDKVPPHLTALKIASSQAARDACRSFAREWRQRRDLRESYVESAGRVEAGLFEIPVDLGIRDLEGLETFSCLERMLQTQVELDLAEKASPEMLDIIRRRQSGFWSEVRPEVQMHWTLLSVLAKLLMEADWIEARLTKSGVSPEAMLRSYAEGDRPWCLLDTYYRWMEQRYQKLDEINEELEILVNRSRDRYMAVGSSLASSFLHSYEKSKLRIEGLPRQYNLFDSQVRPRLSDGKAAYFLVDALRFEMARDLAGSLSGDYDTSLVPVMAAVPTITEIGMAALLPRAQEAHVVRAGDGRLALKIGDAILKDRNDRIAFLKANLDLKVCDLKLDDLLPKPKRHIRESIKAADLILVTSREIDSLCERDDVSLARRAMDDVLDQLQQAFKAMADSGVKTIIVAADHGYLFGDEIKINMKIKPPGGDEADAHRRVWVGIGGARDDSYMRAMISDFGLKSDLELATPWTLACFTVSGCSNAYFHGGLSPQELVVPLMILKPLNRAGNVSPMVWSLLPGTQKITVHFFSVTVSGKSPSISAPEPPKVKLIIKASNDVISRPISASYGFEEATKEVKLRLDCSDPYSIERNTIALEIGETKQKKAVIQLLDVTTGVVLSSREIEVSLLQY